MNTMHGDRREHALRDRRARRPHARRAATASPPSRATTGASGSTAEIALRLRVAVLRAADPVRAGAARHRPEPLRLDAPVDHGERARSRSSACACSCATSIPRIRRSATRSRRRCCELSYEPALYPQGLRGAAARLAVADWWVDEHPPAARPRGAATSATSRRSRWPPAASVEEGMHRIRIERIELRGKFIPASTFRLGAHRAVDGVHARLARDRARRGAADAAPVGRQPAFAAAAERIAAAGDAQPRAHGAHRRAHGRPEPQGPRRRTAAPGAARRRRDVPADAGVHRHRPLQARQRRATATTSATR